MAYLFLVRRRSGMNVTLLKGLVAFVPAGMLFSGSVVLFAKRRTVYPLLQLLSAGCLVVVVLTHVCEVLQLFPWMHWEPEIALVITSIFRVLFLASFYSP